MSDGHFPSSNHLSHVLGERMKFLDRERETLVMAPKGRDEGGK